MRQPPRGREFRLLSPGLVVHSYLFLGLLEALWSLGLFFFVLVDGGWSYGMDLAPDDPLYRSATGIALATILLMQIGNLIGRRYARHDEVGTPYCLTVDGQTSEDGTVTIRYRDDRRQERIQVEAAVEVVRKALAGGE